jgi:HEAT repeat protein
MSAAALGRLGAAAAVPHLIQAQGDEEYLVRSHAAESLARIGKRLDVTIPALTSAFRDPHPEVREHAAMWAGRMRAQGEGAVPALVDLVQSDPAFEVRVQAARSLGQIGPAAASALPALRSVKENENEHRRVRGFAIRAIFRITDKSRDRR